MDRKCSLYSVSACFIQRIAAVHVCVKVFFADRTESDIRWFIECSGMHISTFGNVQGYAGVDLMGTVREHRQHIIGFWFIRRLAKYLALIYDDGIRADHDTVGFPVTAKYILSLLCGQFHYDIHRSCPGDFFFYWRRNYFKLESRSCQ